MAVENVELNSGDNKSDVAYRMALGLWNASHAGANPRIADKVEFLDLVQECARSLSTLAGHRRPGVSN